MIVLVSVLPSVMINHPRAHGDCVSVPVASASANRGGGPQLGDLEGMPGDVDETVGNPVVPDQLPGVQHGSGDLSEMRGTLADVEEEALSDASGALGLMVTEAAPVVAASPVVVTVVIVTGQGVTEKPGNVLAATVVIPVPIVLVTLVVTLVPVVPVMIVGWGNDLGDRGGWVRSARGTRERARRGECQRSDTDTSGDGELGNEITHDLDVFLRLSDYFFCSGGSIQGGAYQGFPGAASLNLQAPGKIPYELVDPLNMPKLCPPPSSEPLLLMTT